MFLTVIAQASIFHQGIRVGERLFLGTETGLSHPMSLPEKLIPTVILNFFGKPKTIVVGEGEQYGSHPIEFNRLIISNHNL